MRRAVIAPAVGLALGLSVLGAVQTFGAQAVASAPATPARVDNFRLVTAAGQSEDLYRYRDAPAVVLVMYAAGRPEIRRIAPALQRLNAAYTPKGVKMMLLDSSGTDSRATIVAETAALGLTAPVLMDDNQLAGSQLGADRVSEVFVIDPHG